MEVDEAGNILDGHHRVRAWTELEREGLSLSPFPTSTREGLSEAEKRTHIRKLNLLRRHLTHEQRRELIADQLKATPQWSDKRIADGLGVSKNTVASVREELEANLSIDKSAIRA